MYVDIGSSSLKFTLDFQCRHKQLQAQQVANWKMLVPGHSLQGAACEFNSQKGKKTAKTEACMPGTDVYRSQF